MSHPLLDEFCRARDVEGLRHDFFRRVQRAIRDEINPQLDERDLLVIQNAELTTEIAALKGKLQDVTAKSKRRDDTVSA